MNDDILNNSPELLVLLHLLLTACAAVAAAGCEISILVSDHPPTTTHCAQVECGERGSAALFSAMFIMLDLLTG